MCVSPRVMSHLKTHRQAANMGWILKCFMSKDTKVVQIMTSCNTFCFSPKDNDFIDERMVLAMELGTLTDDVGIQQKHSKWSKADVELREGIQNLLLEYDLPRK